MMDGCHTLLGGASLTAAGELVLLFFANRAMFCSLSEEDKAHCHCPPSGYGRAVSLEQPRCGAEPGDPSGQDRTGTNCNQKAVTMGLKQMVGLMEPMLRFTPSQGR